MTKIKKNKFKGGGWVAVFFLLLFLFLGASFVPAPEQSSVRNYPELNSVLVRGVLAQKPLEITYPQIPGATTPATTKEALPDYIRYVFQFSLFLGALIALSSLIYGGIRYLTSAGSPSGIKDAKSQISAGILGLIILISAYLILNTINPQLVAFKVSLPGKVPTALPAAGPGKPEPATLVEIPLGGVIENLWGERSEAFPSGFKPADCYQFDDDGNRTTEEPFKNQERLECIQWLSKAIQIKAKKLKEPVEELQKLYDCQNCCRDCCKNVCDWAECSQICKPDTITGNWKNCQLGNLCCEGTQNEGCWENCGAYECCQEKGMVRQYSYQECPYGCCEFFEECPCTQCCGFEADWCERCNCICIKEDEEGEPVCCNPENPDEPYEDLLVRALIDKGLIESGETDPYPDISSIKPALKELRIKLGLFPLTEELKNNKNICCPGDTCPPDSKIGVINCLLKNSETRDLIIKILIGEPVEEEKLKEILKIKSVMAYLLERGWLLENRNLAKTALINAGLLKNEVAINEIAWMGTTASSADEWIELYNNTKENINLTDWKLIIKDKFEIELSGMIPAQGFYLLENDENAVSDINADLVYNGNLADSGEILGLYDEFGNLVEEMDCSPGWFAGDEDLKASLERINPQGCLNVENWTTNLSAQVEGERKEDYINGKDRERNPIYGTPKNPNSVAVSTISYPPFYSLVAELRDKLRSDENLREKLILVLRQDENLERMIKTKEGLRDILVEDDWHFKELLSQKEVLRILLEDEDNLDILLNDPSAGPLVQEVFRRALNMEGEENDDVWEDFITNNLDEARVNSKLINDFQRDLLWVLNSSDLMRGCEEAPISYDQLRVPELTSFKIEEVPEWKDIKRETPIIEGVDPAIFYCHERLW